MPSVLLELGYLSSKEDAKLLMSDAWREKAAADGRATRSTRFFAPRVVAQRRR